MTRMDGILAEVGWIAARRDMRDALTARGVDLADDWLDILTEQAVAIADRGHLDFDVVARAFATAAATIWSVP